MNKFLRLDLICTVLVLVFTTTELSASTVGTFSSARANTVDIANLFDGTFVVGARNALATDGHTLQNLDAGIDATALATVDILYLNAGNDLGTSVLTGAEATAIFTWVNAGGILIVQGEAGLWGQSYNNLATLFGVQYVNASWGGVGITGTAAAYPSLTDGPFGTVSTVQYGASGSIDAGASSGFSIFDNPSGSFLYVLAPDTGFSGSGTAIFLTDVNSFDGPGGSTDGFETADGEALWRNMFSLSGEVSPTYTVGGSVSGLTGTGLELQNNGADTLAVAANGAFVFAGALADTSAYAVTVLTQPSGQTCSVSNGSGVIASANVTDVTVSCEDDVEPPVEPPKPAIPVPTLSEWALVVLSMLLGLMVFANRRRLF